MRLPSFMSDFVARWRSASVPPCFVLTLAEHPWKEAVVLDHFEERNIPTPLIVHGFHGMTTGLRVTTPFQFDQDGTPEYIHLATTGCLLSHLHMLKVAVLSGAPEFICCEDDVEFIPDFVDRWTAVRADFPPDLDVVQLEYVPIKRGMQDPEGNIHMEVMPTVPLSTGLSRSNLYAHCTACIWWKRSAAIQAIRALTPPNAPYDIMLVSRVYPFLSHALATPPLAYQRTVQGSWPASINEPKDIHDPSKYEHKPTTD